MQQTRKVLALGGAVALATWGVLVIALDTDRKTEAAEARPSASRPAEAPTVAQLAAAMDKLRPLHKKLGKPKPGEWLYRFKEPGQTFKQYLACRPSLPRGQRRVIHIQPLGEFTAAQRKVVTRTAEFLGVYFNLAVKTQKRLPLSVIPARARRTHPTWGDKQILTTYVLDEVLRPRLPKDAAVYLALTASDLWPGEGWNFVFGQASLRRRVGVWSIYRNGDPGKSEAAFRTCLLRTLQTASHETGHMFSMQHCTAYQCNMCGANSRAEADRRPLALCPECMAKLCWATRADPARRHVKLAAFCRKNGLKPQAAFHDRSAKVLGATPGPSTTRSAKDDE